MVAKGISQDEFLENGVARRSNRSFRMRTMTVSEGSLVTPQIRGSVDNPSTRGILVDVGLPDTTHENRAESPLYGELYPRYNLSQ